MCNINIVQGFFVQDSVTLKSISIKKSELNFFKANCSANTLTMSRPSFTF